MGSMTLSYEVALHGYGWPPGRYFDGMACGSRTAGAFVTAVRVYSPGFEYRAYLRGEGWSGWRANGADSNDCSTGNPLEALQFRRLDGVPGSDLLYRALFGTEFSALGVASREDVIGAPGSGDFLQVLQIFPVVPVYAQNPDDIILSNGAKLESPVFLGNPSLTGAGRGSLEDLPTSGGSGEDRLSGIGTTEPLDLETAPVSYQSGLIVAEVRRAPAGTPIADPNSGTAPEGTVPEIPDRPKLDMRFFDIRPAASQLLKAASEGRARKSA
jgi:hypothetical protein